MKKMICLLMALLMLLACGLAEETQAEIPSLRKENDADLHEGVYDSYFDDAVFVGDSVTDQLSRYVQEQRQLTGKDVLGTARFLCVGKYSLRHACYNTVQGDVNLRYRRQDVTIQDGLQKMGAGKVFMLLGLNDHAGSGMKDDLVRYGVIIDHVREKNPGIIFVAESCTPIYWGAENETLNRKNLTGFNANLKALCEEKNAYYLDIATPLTGEDGFLINEYAYDKLCHLNEDGLAVWLTELRRFARDQYEQGLWTMETGEAE